MTRRRTGVEHAGGDSRANGAGVADVVTNRGNNFGERGGSIEQEKTGIEKAEQDLLTRFGRSIIDRDIRPRVIINSSAKVLWSSPNASRMLRAPSPVYLHNCYLCFEEGDAAQEGKAFLGALGPEREGRMIASREGDNRVVVSGWAETAGEQRVLFLSFVLPQPNRNCQQSGLARSFGLTQSEAAVLDLLAGLHAPSQIAEKLSITLNTVRSHLKRVHAKLSVKANTELLHIIRSFTDT